jgi:hypothetical protein
LTLFQTRAMLDERDRTKEVKAWATQSQRA